jgi:enoyl-[acyl-carrier protein] reductase II
MYPEVLEEHILKYKQSTEKPFAVNVPMLYPDLDKVMDIILRHHVPIVFTSAGNPKTYTPRLKAEGITVVHVVSSRKFALKSQDAGVDAVVAEGFEAGGHNGREETTTMVLIPMVAEALDIPVIAAGGISTGRAMAAAFALGAEGVQVGSRFAASAESSAHDLFKKAIVETEEGGTELSLKQLTPVRLIKNSFYKQVKDAELRGATVEELQELLGKRRAKRGMFEGDLEEGELEIGQVSAMITRIEPAAEILSDIWHGYLQTIRQIAQPVLSLPTL